MENSGMSNNPLSSGHHEWVRGDVRAGSMTFRLLIALFMTLVLSIVYLSPQFAYGSDSSEKPILLFAGILAAAGCVYIILIRHFRSLQSSARLLTLIFGIGFVLRIAMMFSTPILETDFYRYLWDGAVTAHGFNPYRYSPREVSLAQEDGTIPPQLSSLAVEAEEIIDRINYPHIRTIYPPVAQAIFAAAYRIAPWSLHSLRWVLLLFDVATALLLLKLYGVLNLPRSLLFIYWCNPLLIKELYNSAHMDVLLLPFVLGAVLVSLRGRFTLSALLLALGAGVKVWPVLLFPLIMRPVLFRPKKLVAPLVVFCSLVALLAVPVYLSKLDSGLGFLAYAQRWEMNDALFMAVYWLAKLFVTYSSTAQLIARIITGVFLAGLVVWLSARKIEDHVDVAVRCLTVVAALFLVSPAQFPWYFIWVLPFLALRPVMPLILLTVLLPVYYLRFYCVAHGWTAVFDTWIVWIEYVPVWVLLVWVWWKGRRRGEKIVDK